MIQDLDSIFHILLKYNAWGNTRRIVQCHKNSFRITIYAWACKNSHSVHVVNDNFSSTLCMHRYENNTGITSSLKPVDRLPLWGL